MDILITILTAFISGAMAAALGALGSVILTALVSIIGVFAIMAGCEFNKWLPHMTYGHGYSFWLFGGSVGFIAAYLVYVLSEFSKTVDNPMIAGVSFVPVWAITVVFLILMCCGLPCPVLHHIGLVGAYGGQMAYNAGCSEISVLLWGFAFGIFAHYAGDLLADLFLVYGEGYVDPPSLSMLFCSVFAFVVCPALGLVNPDSPISVIAPVMIIIAFAIAAVITEGKLKKAEA